MAYLLTQIPIRQLDNNGDPVPAARLHTWIAGTTTDLATYTDSTGGTPLPNPVVADANGFWPQVWVSAAAYDLEARLANDITVLWQSINVLAPAGIAEAAVSTLRADLASTSDPAKGATLVGVAGGITVRGSLEAIAYNVTWAGVSTTNTAAVNGALLATVFATEKIVYIPEGTYLCDRELPGIADQIVFGAGQESSTLSFTGATRGIVYTAANLSVRVHLHDFRILGNATALDLLVLDGVKDVRIDRMCIRTTSLSCIKLLNEVIMLRITDAELQAFTKAGVMCSGSLATIVEMDQVRGTAVGSGIVQEAGAGLVRVTTALSVFVGRQINVNGGNQLDHMFVVEGTAAASLLCFDQCYSEFTSGAVIRAKDTAVVTILECRPGCNLAPNSNSFNCIDLNNAQAHGRVIVRGVRRPSAGGYILHPGATTDWSLMQCSRGSGTQFVETYNGFNDIALYGSAGARHLGPFRVDGLLTALGGIALNNSVNFSESAGNLTVNAPGAGDSILLRADGADRMELSARGVKAGVPTYADDAAAGAGGLVANEFYKTAAGALRIKL